VQAELQEHQDIQVHLEQAVLPDIVEQAVLRVTAEQVGLRERLVTLVLLVQAEHQATAELLAHRVRVVIRERVEHLGLQDILVHLAHQELLVTAVLRAHLVIVVLQGLAEPLVTAALREHQGLAEPLVTAALREHQGLADTRVQVEHLALQATAVHQGNPVDGALIVFITMPMMQQGSQILTATICRLIVAAELAMHKSQHSSCFLVGTRTATLLATGLILLTYQPAQ
jgi:hypothetical protein